MNTTYFNELLADLAPEFTRVNNGLLERFQLRPGTPDWSERFSPLTLSYADLHAEAMPVEDEVRRNITYGHCLLVVHSFLEDRLLDGQMEFTQPEMLFVKQLLLEGLARLERVVGSHSLYKKWRDWILREYVNAQVTEYLPQRHSRLHAARVRRIASGRAALGSLGAMALAAAAGADGTAFRLVKNSYDCLVTGLQWSDDLKDWREDLATGDENLLLVALLGFQLNAYTHPANRLREANVGHALLANGIVDHAENQARRWLGYARRRQLALGCSHLAALIEERIEELPNAVQRQMLTIKDDITAVRELRHRDLA